jgi:hypothetical protein
MKKKIGIITQISILVVHFAIIMWYKADRNEAVELINKKATFLNEVTINFNKSLDEIAPKLDSLNKSRKHNS